MHYQLPDLATQHVADLRQAAAAQRRAPARRPYPQLRVRAGWTLVTIGLSLAVRPPAQPRPRAG
ncbi:MAG: hypothetical protein ACRDOK_25040 [Streptosporangiaceae bacterium]